MSGRDRDAEIEAVVSAFREDGPDGQVRPHPTWLDLDATARLLAYEEALRQREIEAALDPDGLSAAARAVLARVELGSKR